MATVRLGKRKVMDGIASAATANKRPAGHWSQGLISSMSDPELKVEEDDLTVTIKDKYPKARFHFLVIPKEHIDSLKKLESRHIPLLKHMQQRGEQLALKTSANSTFRFGYHSVPSMSQIHLHVISQDFDSPSLKTKKHWNSFTSEYFIDSKDLIETLTEKGCTNYNSAKYSEYLKKDLRCHVCKKSLKTIPELKTHIISHIPKVPASKSS